MNVREFRTEVSAPITSLGLSKQEAKDYSLVSAIRSVVDGEKPSILTFERECSAAISKRLGRPVDPFKILVPYDVLQRDLSTTSGGVGGYLVETQNLGFIDLLRNRSVAFKLGARRLPGLRGNVSIPKETAGATGEWLSDQATQLNEQNQTFVQVPLSPKTVGAYTEISRQLLLQSSPSAEAVVTNDLSSACALGVDAGVISGSGADGQPDGIIGFDGVGSVTGTSLGADGLLEFQSDLLAANSQMTSCGYVTTPAIAKTLAGRTRFSNTASPLWEGSLSDGTILGYRALSSNQIPTATMICGDFSEIIVGEWGVLTIDINPFADFKAGIIGIRAMWSIDVAIRNPAAFSVATSIT